MTRISGILVALLLSTAALAQSADLKLLAQSPNQFDASMALVNLGPDVAKNTVVTIDVPPALSIERASVNNVACDTTQRPVRCTVGDMAAFGSGTMFPTYGSLVVQAPIADASYTVTFTITSDTPDPVPSNNSATITWTTKVEADISVLVRSQTDRTDPGGTATFLANVCNSVRDNAAAPLRTEITTSNGTIESVRPATGFTCTIDGATAVCTHPGLGYDCPIEHFEIVVRTSDSRAGGEARLTITNTITDPAIAERTPADNTSYDSAAIYRWIAVTSTADAGVGTLREAVADANANCTPGPCRIVFEIPGPPPTEGWFTIVPSEELKITAARVTMEGSHQTRLTGDTNPNGPEIAIDGRAARRGLKFPSACEAVIEGLAIGNFDEDQGLWIGTQGVSCGNRPDRREVTGNHIGVDPSGTVPWPNRRGLRGDYAFVTVRDNVISHNRHSGIWSWNGSLDVRNNRLERNGASGILLGPHVWWANIQFNVINNHPQMGVAAAAGSRSVAIRGNSMKNNGGLGIDWGLDGVSPRREHDHEGPTNAPVLLNARYDAATNKTIVTGNYASEGLGGPWSLFEIDFYANHVPDGDGEVVISPTFTDMTNQSFVATFHGDLRGVWINATLNRIYYSQLLRGPRTDSHLGIGHAIMTSELSNSVHVE